MSLEKTVNEAIIETIANRVLEKLQMEFRSQWGSMVSEWVDNRKAITELSAHITKLESNVTEQANQIYKLALERQTMKETSVKALEILNVAKKELGLP